MGEWSLSSQICFVHAQTAQQPCQTAWTRDSETPPGSRSAADEPDGGLHLVTDALRSYGTEGADTGRPPPMLNAGAICLRYSATPVVRSSTVVPVMLTQTLTSWARLYASTVFTELFSGHASGL